MIKNTSDKKCEEFIELGTRTVGRIHDSDIVTLPKPFTNNYLGKDRTVQVAMTLDGKLILSPVRSAKKEGGIKVE